MAVFGEPAPSVPVPSTVEPSLKVTVPVGVPPTGAVIPVAVSGTGCWVVTVVGGSKAPR